jgi:histidine ammonia-lyase
VIDNVERILAIELLNAAQAMDFRRPKRSSEIIESVITYFRKKVSFNKADRILHLDMSKAVEFIRTAPPEGA